MTRDQIAIFLELGRVRREDNQGVPAIDRAAKELASTPTGHKLDADLIAFALGVHGLRLGVPTELVGVIVREHGWQVYDQRPAAWDMALSATLH